MMGFDTWDRKVNTKPLVIDCVDAPETCSPGRHKFSDCEKEEICAKIDELNKIAWKEGGLKGAQGSYDDKREAGNAMAARLRGFAMRGSTHQPDLQKMHAKGFKHLSPKCEKETREKAENSKPPYKGFSADHRKEIQFCGAATDIENFKWMSRRPNRWIGGKLSAFKTSGPDKHTGVRGTCC